MTSINDILNDLEAKARAVIRDHEPAAMFAFGEACSPDTVLALITALREAEEAMSMGAFHHNSCPWLNGKECYCAREKVDKWLAKYARGEK